ncbi:MAG: DUF502 domain-containing protein [Verrucomicrobiota bacterium]
MFRSLRNAFITGIVVILPLGVTTIVLNFLLEKLGTPSSGLFFWFVDPQLREVPAISFILEATSVMIVCILITALGYGSRFVVGRVLLSGFEQLLDRLPFINTVYRTVKQIVDTFSQQNKAVFQEVVLIEYPRKRCYVLGFLTSEAKGEPQDVTGERIVNIFVPTTPNPTSGFLLMVPEDDVTRLTMSVADGMKVIISGGAVVPPGKNAAVRIENPAELSGAVEA